MRLNVPSHVVPYTEIVPSRDSPHANARQQPASQPASICSFLGRRSTLGRSGSGRSGQVRYLAVRATPLTALLLEALHGGGLLSRARLLIVMVGLASTELTTTYAQQQQ